MKAIQLLAAAGLLLFPLYVQAEDHLAKARELFARMKYAQALWHVDQIVKSDKSGPEDLVQAYQTRGFCLLGLGKKKLAVGAFRNLLAIDPDFRLDARVSPKFRPHFETARQRAARTRPIGMIHEQPPEGNKPAGLELEVTLTGNPMRMVRSIRFHYETLDGSTGQRARRVKRPGSYSLRVPEDVEAPALSYWFEALNRYGAVLHRLGSRVEPFRYPPEEQPAAVADATGTSEDAAGEGAANPGDTTPDLNPPLPAPPDTMATAGLGEQDENEEERDGATPWYQTWWFWTGVGVVVAGATTGIIVATSAGGGTDGIQYDVSLR